MKLPFKRFTSLFLLLSGCAAASLSHADSWGPLVELRDNSNLFPNNKPSGGWTVTPIHATLLTDGNVLITGWGRRDLSGCGSGGSRKNGTSFVLNPNTLPNGGILNIQPINEMPASGTEDVLYCAGHSPLADGRILHTGGARYTDLGGSNQQEYGLNYSRVFSQSSNTFVPVSSPMLGGVSGMEGMAWYPTNTRMADGKVMVIGGFSRCCDSSYSNRTLQTFDPVAFDQGQNPWTLISPHNAAPGSINPGIRDYIHSFLLPQPVTINGLVRKMAFMGANGQIIYANTDVGTPDNQRFVAASNGQRAFNAGGWDSTAALVSTGEIMTAGGTDDNGTAQRIDLYQPTTSSTRTIDTGIGRRNASSVLLPDGTVLLINGGTDERNYAGDRRRPQIINLETGTVSTMNPWSNDNLERGYHNFALLLKDGRVLLGGGISPIGDIGCERSDLRVYSPNYLTAGTRPVISNPPNAISMTTGGATLALNYSGEALKSSAQGGVVLMAVGSTTHSFDQNQRHVKLSYTQSGNSLTITPPANTQIAPPGDYIMFLVAQSGAPSTGVTVRIEKSLSSSSSSVSNSSTSPVITTPFHFRGTHNGWAEGDLMTAVVGSSTNFEICRNFTAGDGGGGPRFKIDPNGGWGSDPFPAADVAASGWTKVVINGSTRVIISTATNLPANCGAVASSSAASSVVVSSSVASSVAVASSSVAASSVASSSAALVSSSSSSVITTPFHFRGTHNGWAEGDLMTAVVGSSTNFEACRDFTVSSGGTPRFKIDPNGGWGADAFPAADVAASGWTKVVINGSTRVIVSINTNLAANCGAAASSSAASSSLVASSAVASSSVAVASSSVASSSVAISSSIAASSIVASSSIAASSVASSSQAASSSAAVQIIMKPTATVTSGQLVYVVGNQAVLSSWNSAAGVPCALNSGSSSVWTCQGFSLPAGTAYEYKYIKRNASGAVVWESGANRSRTAPSVTTSYSETWK